MDAEISKCSIRYINLKVKYLYWKTICSVFKYNEKNVRKNIKNTDKLIKFLEELREYQIRKLKQYQQLKHIRL